MLLIGCWLPDTHFFPHGLREGSGKIPYINENPIIFSCPSQFSLFLIFFSLIKFIPTTLSSTLPSHFPLPSLFSFLDLIFSPFVFFSHSSWVWLRLKILKQSASIAASLFRGGFSCLMNKVKRVGVVSVLSFESWVSFTV